MKKLLLTACLNVLLLNLLIAQSDVEEKLKEEIWTNCPSEFKVTAIPDKWKNESAVILALKKEYSAAKNFEEKVHLHFRIKLLDKAAVEDFSEISFDHTQYEKSVLGKVKFYKTIGIKVIKPSGTVKEVDLSKAVRTDAGDDKDLKIPIPNLEPGDIVDYFFAVKAPNYGPPDWSDEDILEGKYPTLISTRSFQLAKDFFFHGFSYNGAPAFKKEEIGKDIVYTLKDEMREKAPDMHWEYAYRTSPHVRYYINSKKEHTDFKEQAFERTKSLKKYSIQGSDVGFIIDYMNANFKKEKDQKKIVEEVYYLLRNPIYRDAYFQYDLSQPLETDYTPNKFFMIMAKYLDVRKIPYDFIIVPSRRAGNFSQLADLSSCDFILKVNTSPVIYISRPTPFTLITERAYVTEGMEGIATPIKRSLENYSSVKVDSSSVKDNTVTVKFRVSLNSEDKTKVDVKRSVEATGHTKDYHQYLIYTNYDYLKQYDMPKYQAQSSLRCRNLIAKYNKEKEKFDQRVTQEYHERDEKVKTSIEKEMLMKISEYKSLSIKSVGMWEDAANVEYSDEFSIDDMTKKAGPNIIVELGKLIGEQTKIKDKERLRKRDIFMEYPRSFADEIVFSIPEGYKVEGLEGLTKKVESTLGGFTSTATVSENILTVKIKKFYNVNHYQAADWAKITEFLDAAVDFYGAKILLKKG